MSRHSSRRWERDLSDLYTVTDLQTGTVAIVDGDELTITSTGGVDAGTITSLADDVVDEINDVADEASTYLTAAMAVGDDGSTAVTLFNEVGYYGSANMGLDDDANNYLQFLGPNGTSDYTFTFVTGGAEQVAGH